MINKNILLATDLSDLSTKAILHIGPLIKKLQGKLSLIYVVKSYFSDWISSHEVQRVAEQRMRQYLQRLQDDGTQTGNVIIEVGNVADQVLAAADGMDADIIIIGAEEKSALQRVIFGASAEAIVRQARQIVWIHKADSFEGINKIVCGVDFSPSSKGAFEKALSMAQTFGAKLEVLHVLHEPNVDAIGLSQDIEEEKVKAFKEKKTLELEQFINTFELKGQEVDKKILWGSPAQTLLNYAKDYDTDLIVLGEKGTTQMRRIIMGSTTEKVMRTAPCSMLICR
jgi:nucleotide-binding universal stress UspA family protein